MYSGRARENDWGPGRAGGNRHAPEQKRLLLDANRLGETEETEWGRLWIETDPVQVFDPVSSIRQHASSESDYGKSSAS